MGIVVLGFGKREDGAGCSAPGHRLVKGVSPRVVPAMHTGTGIDETKGRESSGQQVIAANDANLPMIQFDGRQPRCFESALPEIDDRHLQLQQLVSDAAVTHASEDAVATPTL